MILEEVDSFVGRSELHGEHLYCVGFEQDGVVGGKCGEWIAHLGLVQAVLHLLTSLIFYADSSKRAL